MSAEDKDEAVEDLKNPEVVTKYRLAGDISNNALTHVIALCKPGARVVEVCSAGDKFIEDATSKIYKGKKVEKGVGFPTCVSVNNIVGHFSPVDTDETVLKAGDLIKIDLGAHVDGYVTVLAHTMLVGEEGPAVCEGKSANVLAAAYYASELALRMLKIGHKNSEVTEMIAKVAADFNVTPVSGVLSHSMKRFVIDGDKVIINKESTEHKVEEVEFEPDEVYAVDIVMSTGKGEPKEIDSKQTTVYKRSIEETYQLKMKASRATLSDITKRYPAFPFTLRNLDAKTARFGISECANHNLVQPYPVLYEKEGELLAHVKFTALLMPNGPIKAAGPQITPEMFKTELSVTDPDLKKLLATAAGPKKKKKNKKKKAANAAEDKSEA